MQLPRDLRPIRLHARDVHRIEDGQGLAVTCLRGNVWITQDRDVRDVVLSPGQSFVLDRNGLALAFAFKDATILVGQPGQVWPADAAEVARYRAA
jgi:Protein of unknown function (DUF2917)